MSFGLPGWWLGFAIALVIISVARNIFGGVGLGIGRFSRRRNQDELEQRLADVEQAQRQLGSGDTADLERRVAELEERLDFAERMLAKKNEAERLVPPKY